MKTRSSSGVGQKVDLEFNVETLRILDLGEDGESSSPSPSPSTSSVYRGLKRTSTTTAEPDPTVGSPAPRMKPQAKSGADIRNMLASLNAERD
jgi:hypothetical protein